jgi:two-component system, chemotaxis family, chemotaxis protein CheY
MQKSALIVDDSATMRNMIKVVVEKLGFECITAQDGEKALKILGERTVEIIITDINMPNMGGIELVKNLRAQKNSKYTPILVITTEGGTDVKSAGKAAGASGWIIKPFNPDALVNAVTKLTNG